MGFDFDDVMQVIQIVKESKDTELHIDTGDIKLSLFKGDVGDSAGSPLNFSCASASAQAAASVAAPAPAAAEAPAAVTPAPEPETKEAPKVDEAPAIEAVNENDIEEGLIPIKANVTSVFYRRPSPSEPPFVEVGDEVQNDSVLCLLEVMKCFRQVMADMRGRIEKICVESNTLVEQGTVLFLIRPEE